MKGDFARITYDATRHVRRVLRQQGRVDVEADWNEQASAILHNLEAIMRDLVGPYGGVGNGFQILPDGQDFDLLIGSGHYWVNGILCENENRGGTPFSAQPGVPTGMPKPAAGAYLVYLDVWERHLCPEEAPWTVEVALGGPDTSSRSVVVWQVKLAPLPKDAGKLDADTAHAQWATTQQQWQPLNRGLMQARAVPLPGALDPCVMPPDSRYRGPENQLYRVEIHDPGQAGAGATFKWSRDNGSVVYAIHSLSGTTVTLQHLPLDPRRTLKADDWFEVVDDRTSLLGLPGPMGQVTVVDYDEQTVDAVFPGGAAPLPAYGEASAIHPYLRRWDQESGPIPLEEGTWIDLEDGVQVRFNAPPPAVAEGVKFTNTYRTGDYWSFPARVVIGDVEWPPGPSGPLALPPQGVTHSYAPLAAVRFAGTGKATIDTHLRRRIVPPVQNA
jgi:hypothetical protein